MAAADGSCAAGTGARLCGGLCRGAACAPEGGGASRPQAREHSPEPRGCSQGGGFRSGGMVAAGQHGSHTHPAGRTLWIASVDAAGAGPRGSAVGRHPQRYSCAGSRSVLSAERASTPRRQAGSAGPAGSGAVGRPSAAACHRSEDSARPCGYHREVSLRSQGEAVPECFRTGGRCAPLARRPAGAGTSGFGPLLDGPQAPASLVRGGRGRRRPRRRIGLGLGTLPVRTPTR